MPGQWNNLSISSPPNGFILIDRAVEKPFAVFHSEKLFPCLLVLFNGLVVCFGEITIQFLCSFGDENIAQEGDIVRILGYIGVNSSILLVTAMSIDRFNNKFIIHRIQKADTYLH